MKFSPKVGNGPMNKRLNFSGDLDQRSGSGSGSWIRMDAQPNHDTGKMCLGGGTHCPIASSVFVCLFVSSITQTITGWIVMKYGATDHRRVG